MLFKNKFFIVVILLLIFIYGSHLTVTRPQNLKQTLFPLEAQIASLNMDCSEGAPEKLMDLLDFSMHNLGSLANQIAYRDSKGNIYHCEGGWVDSFFGEPVKETHRYRYASITKLVTADLILRLVEEKKLSMDTRLLSIFPEITPLNDTRVNDITIAHLLDHSAGFNRLTPEGDVMFFSAKKKWCPFNLQQLSKERLSFAPGEKQIYSNLGYCLLGSVIEKVSGNPYKEFAKKTYELDNLGIKFIDKSFLPDEVKYDFRFEPMYSENYQIKYDLNAASAAVGLSGSAVGLVQLMENILSRPGLSLLDPPDSTRCSKDKNEKCFGHAFFYYKVNASVFYIHDGYLPGATSLIVVDSDGGIFVMLNAGRAKEQNRMERKAHYLVSRFLLDQSASNN